MSSERNVNLTFGEWLEDALDALDMTQEAFGDLAGVGQATVSNWVNDRRVPTERNCARIARALGVDVNEVRTRAGYPPRSTVQDPRPRRDFHDPLFQQMRAGALYWSEEFILDVLRRAEEQDEERSE